MAYDLIFNWQFYLNTFAELDGPVSGNRKFDLKPTIFAHLLTSAKV
jgi:hypothetical protein